MQSVLAELSNMAERLRHTLPMLADLDEQDIGPLLRHVQATRTSLDCLEAALAARYSQMTTPVPVKDLLAGTPSEVARRAKRADVASGFPTLHEGWGHGTVAAERVDAVASTLRRLNHAQKRLLAEADTTLADAAASESAEVFAARLKRLEEEITGADQLTRQAHLRESRFHRKWFDDDGCLNGRYRLDPENSVPVNAALEAEMTRRYSQGRDDRTLDGATELIRDHAAADALSTLITGGGPANRTPAGMIVVADPRLVEPDPELSVHGTDLFASCQYLDGTPLPREMATRLLCDEDLWLVRSTDHGEHLDLYRRARSASAPQRAVLAVLHPTCAVPQCNVPFEFCQVHHVRFWDSGGGTNLNNLVPVCNHHHRLVHDHRWRLELHPDRGRSLVNPEGEVVGHARAPDPAVLKQVPHQYAQLCEHVHETVLARSRLARVP